MELNTYTSVEKDIILRQAFDELIVLGIEFKWAKAEKPFTELQEECRLLATDPVFIEALRVYLQDHAIIFRSLEMFFTQISMSARAKWYEVPDEIRPITARGWFLGRWIPTFLILDGPIGRFIGKGGSPLFEHLKNHYSRYPLLSSARDFLGIDIFRKLRNGFGHWSFDWEINAQESYVVAYDWKSGLPTAKLHQKQADAFHIAAFALIEILDGLVKNYHPTRKSRPSTSPPPR